MTYSIEYKIVLRIKQYYSNRNEVKLWFLIQALPS